MDAAKKQRLLHWAEVIDSWRVFPRLFLASCFIWAVWMAWYLLKWYTHLPASDRGIEAAGFGAITFSGVLTFLKMVYSDYASSGRNWNAVQPVATSQTTLTSTQTAPT